MEKRVIVLMLFIMIIACPNALSYEYYVPGLYTGADTHSFLDMFNPSDSEAVVDVSILYAKNDSGSMELRVAPGASVREELTSKISSTYGLVLSSEKELAVQAVQYDSTYSSGFGYAVDRSPGFVWYFGEGYSSGMVKSYLYFLNPGMRSADVSVTLYYDNGQKKTFNLDVPASKHLRFDLKEKTQPEKRFAVKVTSTAPIVVGSGNFNKHFKGASGSLGAADVAKEWTFADGYVSDSASDFLNVLNPSLGVAHVTVNIYYDDGEVRSFDETVDAGSKKMIMLNNHVMKNRWYSVVLTSDVGVVAEKTHYDDTYSAGHGAFGSTAPVSSVYFPYLFKGSKVHAHLAVFNPSDEADILLEFHYSADDIKVYREKAPSKMRSTIDIDELATDGKPFSILFQSSEPVYVSQVVYDERYGSGYQTRGTALEIHDVQEEEEAVVVDDITQGNTEYVLVEEDILATSKFGDGMEEGLQGVVSYTYDHHGSRSMAWEFSYIGDRSAEDAYSSVLSGALFKLLEVGPASVAGMDVHHFVTSKSRGYAWQNGDTVYIFVASDDDEAAGLAEMFIANTAEAGDDEGVKLSTILLLLVVLILLVVIIRSIFRKQPEEEDEDDLSVWEEQIPSAKPATKAKKKAKGPKKKLSPVRHQKCEVDKKGKKPALKKAARKKPAKKEEQKEKPAPAKKRGRPKKTEKKEIPPERKISIKEIPHEKLTAQDILDNLEDIPDYDDVFRHVNRDQEEVKRK